MSYQAIETIILFALYQEEKERGNITRLLLCISPSNFYIIFIFLTHFNDFILVDKNVKQSLQIRLVYHLPF